MEKTFRQHLLRAVLISFAVAAIYGVTANFLITGLYAEIFNVVVSVAIFFTTILFYFLFKYFKSKQRLRPFLITVGILIVTVLVFNSNLDIFLINLTNTSKLPVKYERYQEVNAKKTVRFGNYEMKFAFKSYEPVFHFISANNNLIVLTSKIPTDRDSLSVAEDQKGGGTIIYQDFTFYKLNADAKVIDEYVFKRTFENFNEMIFGDFLINTDEDYFTTWVIDGDKTKHPFIKQNENLDLSDVAQLENFEKIKTGATYYKITDDRTSQNDNKARQHIYYYLAGSWYKFSIIIDYPEDDHFSDERGETTNLGGLFGRYVPNTWGKDPDYKPFKPIYFQRVKMIDDSDTFINFRTTSRQIDWQGNLYCNLTVDKDTLRFIKPLVFTKYFQTNEMFRSKGKEIQKYKAEIEQYFHPYFYYTSKKIPFKLFTLDPRELYIIKKIN